MGSLMEARRRILLSSPHKETIQNADIASFSTDMRSPLRSLTLPIDPVQDLHGYDAPWPSGGGANKINFANCTAGITAFGLTSAVSGEQFTFSGTCSSGGTHTWKFAVVNSEQRPVATSCSFAGFVISGASGLAITSIIYDSGDYKLSISLGGLVTNQSYNFTIGVVAYTGAAPTSWSPYSNICPISGWTEANLWRTGKNLDPYDNLHRTNRLWGTDSPNQKKVFQSLAVGTYTMSCKFEVLTNPDAESTLQYGVLVRYSNGQGGYVTIIPYQLISAPATVGAVYEWSKSFTLTKSLAGESTLTVYFYCASGGTSTVTANAYDIQIELGSTPTAYTPYTGTTYPITIPALGKNLLDPSKMTTYSSGNGRRWYYADGYTLKANQAYTISVSGTSQLITLYFIEKSTGATLASGSAGGKITYTPETDMVVYFQAYRGEVIQDANNFQLELGSTATPYEPYTNTVYGGYISVSEDGSAELVVDKAMKVFSGEASEGWTKSEYNYFVSPRISDAIDRNATPSDFQSNLFPYGTISNGSSTLGACLIWAAVRVRLADMSISLYDWKTQLANTPMQVVYTLATPLHYPLSNIAVTTLKGQNVLWADCGPVELLKYWTHK